MPLNSMSLNWYATKMADTSALYVDGKKENGLSKLGEWMIFMTMAVEMGDITEKNVVEFYIRLRLWVLVTVGKIDPFTCPSFTTVKKFIGLKTNVVMLSRAAFMKKIGAKMEENVHFIARDEERSPTEKAADGGTG